MPTPMPNKLRMRNGFRPNLSARERTKNATDDIVAAMLITKVYLLTSPKYVVTASV